MRSQSETLDDLMDLSHQRETRPATGEFINAIQALTGPPSEAAPDTSAKRLFDRPEGATGLGGLLRDAYRDIGRGESPSDFSSAAKMGKLKRSQYLADRLVGFRRPGSPARHTAGFRTGTVADQLRGVGHCFG